MEESASRSRFNVRPATAPSCLYCREAFADGEPIFACEGCGVGYHRDCMRDELGSCATLGCEGTRAMPQRARGPAGYQREQALREALGRREDCAFGPLGPQLEGQLRQRLARGMSRDETPLVVIRDGQGTPQAVFSDRAAYLDFSGGQLAQRLAFDDLTLVQHDRGLLRLTLGGEGQRLVRLLPGSPQAELRRFFAGLLDQAWKTGRGFACDRCLIDFESLMAFVECRGCGACRHIGCAEGPCPGAGCEGADLVKRLAPRFLPGAGGPSSSGGCPVCSEAFEAGDPTLTCDACEAVYHAACLRGLGSCATRGCGGRRATPGRHPRDWLLVAVGAVLFVAMVLAALLSV